MYEFIKRHQPFDRRLLFYLQYILLHHHLKVMLTDLIYSDLVVKLVFIISFVQKSKWENRRAANKIGN